MHNYEITCLLLSNFSVVSSHLSGLLIWIVDFISPKKQSFWRFIEIEIFEVTKRTCLVRALAIFFLRNIAVARHTFQGAVKMAGR